MQIKTKMVIWKKSLNHVLKLKIKKFCNNHWGNTSLNWHSNPRVILKDKEQIEVQP